MFCSFGSSQAQSSVARQQREPCTTFFQTAEVVSGGWCPLATSRSKSESSPEEVFPYRGVQNSPTLRSYTKILKHTRGQATESRSQQTQHTADTGSVRKRTQHSYIEYV